MTTEEWDDIFPISTISEYLGKKITKDTVLKQLIIDEEVDKQINASMQEYSHVVSGILGKANKYKSYPAIQTEQGIVWVEENPTFKIGDRVPIKYKDGTWKIHTVLKPGTKDWAEHALSTGRIAINLANSEMYVIPKGYTKIIAANFELEKVPKIELEDEVETLAEIWINDRVANGDDKTVASYRNGFYDGYKANQAKENENIRKAFIAGREHISVKGYTQVEFLNDVDVYLQSLNSIKEITVDENFKQT